MVLTFRPPGTRHAPSLSQTARYWVAPSPPPSFSIRNSSSLPDEAAAPCPPKPCEGGRSRVNLRSSLFAPCLTPHPAEPRRCGVQRPSLL